MTFQIHPSKLVIPFEKEAADDYLVTAMQWVLLFEKEILNSSTKTVFFSMGFTKRGAEYVTELIKTWKYVRPNLEKYAYHALAPVDEFELSIPLLNEEGRPISAKKVE